MTKLLLVTLASTVAGVSLWGWGRTAIRASGAAGLPGCSDRRNRAGPSLLHRHSNYRLVRLPAGGPGHE